MYVHLPAPWSIILSPTAVATLACRPAVLPSVLIETLQAGIRVDAALTGCRAVFLS